MSCFGDNKDTCKPSLIILGGLPGTGKTSIAKELAVRLNAVYVRIDTIEQALLREGALIQGHEGYVVAYDIAADNLRIGHRVIADCVNPLPVTRDAWRDVARKTDARFYQIEVICSDLSEHKKRIEERQADIAGHVLPTWSDVLSHDYQPWPNQDYVVDTANITVGEAVGLVLEYIARQNH